MGGIISAEPMPSSSEYPMISCGSPNDSSASTPPTAYTIRPSTKHRLRPQMSVSLLPGIISTAMVSVNRVIAVCTPATSVPRSVAIALIATFMLVAA
jgi:hypothetical protein